MTANEDLALAALVHVLPADGTILELGTGIGGSSANMLRARPDVSLVTIDNLSLRGPRLRSELRKLGLPQSTTQDDVISMALAPFGGRVERRLSDDLELDRIFDLVLIDGAHDVESVRRDTDALNWRARPAGILAFHDYGNDAGGGGVCRAVTEWRAASGWPTYWRELLRVETLVAFQSIA